MVTLKRFIPGAWLACALTCADLTLACSSEDRIALAQMGQSAAQIDAQCGSGGNPFVTPSMPVASVCVTWAGACQMAEQIPVGSRCWCPTGYGNAIDGVAR